MAKTLKMRNTDERREAQRHSVEMTLPAHMQIAASSRDVNCRINDVSSDGLSVHVDEELAEGEVLLFVTLRAKLKLTVTRCQPAPGRGFHCGLRLGSETDPAELRRIFTSLLTPPKVG